MHYGKAPDLPLAATALERRSPLQVVAGSCPVGAAGSARSARSALLGR